MAEGVIKPLIVSHHPETNRRYMLIAGERRWRAAGKAGLTLVPVVVRDLSNDQRLAVQLVENIDREELSVMEESLAVVRLFDFGRKPKEVADMLQQDQVGRAMVHESVDLAKARYVESGHPKKRPMPEVTDPSESAHGDEEAAAERAGTSARSRSDGDAEVPDPESPAAGADGKGPARPKASKTRRKGDSGSEGEGDAYDEVARALQARVGLPVTIDAPRDGKSGELRIGFASLLELEGRQLT
jgi:ParB family chromosome partitioning protein